MENKILLLGGPKKIIDLIQKFIDLNLKTNGLAGLDETNYIRENLILFGEIDTKYISKIKSLIDESKNDDTEPQVTETVQEQKDQKEETVQNAPSVKTTKK